VAWTCRCATTAPPAFGGQGRGKTPDLLAPALLAHPGTAMATLTKLDDLLLTLLTASPPAGAARLLQAQMLLPGPIVSLLERLVAGVRHAATRLGCTPSSPRCCSTRQSRTPTSSRAAPQHGAPMAAEPPAGRR